MASGGKASGSRPRIGSEPSLTTKKSQYIAVHRHATDMAGLLPEPATDAHRKERSRMDTPKMPRKNWKQVDAAPLNVSAL